MSKRINSVLSSRMSLALHRRLNEEPIIELDGSWTRHNLAESLGCANIVAATRLGRNLRALNISSVKLLYNMDPASLLRINGVGEVQLWVVTLLLDYHGYNVEKWWNWAGEGKFSSYKHRVARKAKKKR